jgi:hypothetical protein
MMLTVCHYPTFSSSALLKRIPVAMFGEVLLCCLEPNLQR